MSLTNQDHWLNLFVKQTFVCSEEVLRCAVTEVQCPAVENSLFCCNTSSCELESLSDTLYRHRSFEMKQTEFSSSSGLAESFVMRYSVCWSVGSYASANVSFVSK